MANNQMVHKVKQPSTSRKDAHRNRIHRYRQPGPEASGILTELWSAASSPVEGDDFDSEPKSSCFPGGAGCGSSDTTAPLSMPGLSSWDGGKHAETWCVTPEEIQSRVMCRSISEWSSPPAGPMPISKESVEMLINLTEDLFVTDESLEESPDSVHFSPVFAQAGKARVWCGSSLDEGLPKEVKQ
eukprot:TRINITY_DN8430_c0_g1_i2.p1 TRINITY_DN8430_c0_g1~~TRINITY_DN8430_c0_g1_i2.p1  ORF type:complete len:185 (+),score=30.55 TRINITY_DN8430_c0_g1_i2:95-649(+)